MSVTITQINARIGVDTSALTAGLAAAKSQVAAFAQQTNAAFTGLSKGTQAAAVGIQGVGTAGSNAGQQLQNNFTSRLNNAGAVMTRFGQSAQAMGASLTRNLSLPLLALGANAVRIQANFEDSLNQLKGATGASAEQMGALAGKAKELGDDLTLPGTSAVSAAQAMLALSRAGLTVKDVFDAARPTMQLSAATHVTNAEAATMLAVAENQFGIAAKDSAKAADILTAAGNRTVGGVNALFSGLKLVGPVMSGLHVPMGDAVTSLSLLNKNGLMASVAGSALKTSLSLLADPSKKAKAVLDALGISLFDQNGQFKGMAAMAEILHDKLGKLTDQQRLMAEHALGGTRAMLALNILAKEGGKGFDEMSGKVNKAGEAARQAELQMQGLPGALKKMQTAFTAASQSAIEPLSKDLVRLGDSAGKLLTKFAELPPGTRKAIVEFLAFVAALGPVLFMFGKTATAAGALAKGIAEIKAGTAIAQMSSAGIAVKGLGAAFTWAKGIITGFVAFLGGPVTIALAALAAAVALFATAWAKDWFDIREQFQAAWDTITQIWDSTLPTMQSAWTAFTDLLQGNWVGAWQNMKAVVVDVVGFIARLMLHPIDTIKGLVEQFGANFQERMLAQGAGPQGGGAAPHVPNLGPSGTHHDFTGVGTHNADLDEIGKSAKKAETDSEKLNDALADSQRRLSLLRSGMKDSAVELAQQYNNDQTVSASDPRLKQLDNINKLTKAIEDQRTGLQNFKDAWQDVRSQIKLGKAELASGLTGGGEVANLSKQFKANIPTGMATGYLADVNANARIQKQIDAKKAFDKQQYDLSRESYLYQGKIGGTGLLFTEDQISAMIAFKKNAGELTEAELKLTHANIAAARTIAGNKALLEEVSARRTRDAQATQLATLAQWKSNDAWQAFIDKSKYAERALLELGVNFKNLTAKQQEFVKHKLDLITQHTDAMNAYRSFAEGVTGIFDNMFMNVNKGFKGMLQTFVQGFEQLLQQMAAKYLASQLAKLFLNGLGSAFGGKGIFADILGGLSGRASGGLVAQDTPYLVGEHGPELFTPSRTGRIASARQTAGAMAGGGHVTVNMVVHATDANSFSRSQHQIASDASRMMQQAMRRNGR